jgi:hypothetical protein
MINQPGYIPALLHEQTKAAEISERNQRITTAWAYYEGRHPDQLMVRRGQPNDNTIVNLARQVVDKGVSMLFGNEIEWQFDETDVTESPAEEYVDGIWAANDKPALLTGIAMNGALAGIAVVKVVMRMDGRIRLINLDPAYVDICTEEEDINEVWRYRIQFKVDRQGAGVTRREDITCCDGGWMIENYEALDAGPDQQWHKTGESLWPYAQAPIIWCQNLINPNSVWGYTDLEDVQLNDAINGSVSSTRKIIRLHASPQTIGKGVTVESLRRGADQFWEIPGDGDVYNLEMSSDLAAARQFYLDMRAAFYAQGRMPDMSQVGNLGALTNFGLRVLFADALERTMVKRAMYGGLISRINNLLAIIGGYGEQETTISWPDPLPTNSSELVDTTVKKQGTGLVSDETLTTEMGYDYDDEQLRIDAEQAANPAPIIPAMPVPADQPVADASGVAEPQAAGDQHSQAM